MKYELTSLLAKSSAMRSQCLDARKKIAAAKESLHGDVQEDVEVYGRMSARERPGAATAYEALLKSRSKVGN